MYKITFNIEGNLKIIVNTKEKNRKVVSDKMIKMRGD